MFYIGFTTSPRVAADGVQRATGEITLGDDSPRFESEIGHWSVSDYETSWRDAVLRLAGGQTSSALVTSYHGPATRGHEVWPMRREGSTVIVCGSIVVDQIDSADSNDDSVAAPASREWRFPLGQLLAFAVHE